MGCDIHAHVETGYVGHDGNMHWSNLCEFRFGRNYVLFALMAGVRRYNYYPEAAALEAALAKRGATRLDDPILSEAESEVIIQEASDSGITRGQPSFPEKGIPKDICFRTAREYTLCVVDDDNPEADSEHCCNRTRANSWLASGSSEPWDVIDGKVLTVTGPDWHTPSWLNADEVVTLSQRFKLALHDEDIHESISMKNESLAKVEGLAAMMQLIERNSRLKARLVFWFDN